MRGTLCHSFSSRGSPRLSSWAPPLRELLVAWVSFLPSSPYLARMTRREMGGITSPVLVRGRAERPTAAPRRGAGLLLASCHSSCPPWVSGDHAGWREHGHERVWAPAPTAVPLWASCRAPFHLESCIKLDCTGAWARCPGLESLPLGLFLWTVAQIYKTKMYCLSFCRGANSGECGGEGSSVGGRMG